VFGKDLAAAAGRPKVVALIIVGTTTAICVAGIVLAATGFIEAQRDTNFYTATAKISGTSLPDVRPPKEATVGLQVDSVSLPAGMAHLRG
jgi:hypothetical protein